MYSRADRAGALRRLLQDRFRNQEPVVAAGVGGTNSKSWLWPQYFINHRHDGTSGLPSVGAVAIHVAAVGDRQPFTAKEADSGGSPDSFRQQPVEAMTSPDARRSQRRRRKKNRPRRPRRPIEPTEFVDEEPTPPPRPPDATKPKAQIAKSQSRWAAVRPGGHDIRAKAQHVSAPRPAYPYEARRSKIRPAAANSCSSLIRQWQCDGRRDGAKHGQRRFWTRRPPRLRSAAGAANRASTAKSTFPITFTLEGAQILSPTKST